MLAFDGSTITFPSGRFVDAHMGFIGLSPGMNVSTGYDDWEGDEWTPEDRAALADYMIALWTKFRDVGK